MTSLSATYHWPLALERMHEGLTRQLIAAHPAFALVDIYGDESASLLTVEVAELDGDRLEAAWTLAGHLAAVLWNEGDDWLPSFGVDLLVAVAGLRIHTPCATMAALSRGQMSRPAWLAASAVELSPAV